MKGTFTPKVNRRNFASRIIAMIYIPCMMLLMINSFLFLTKNFFILLSIPFITVVSFDNFLILCNLNKLNIEENEWVFVTVL